MITVKEVSKPGDREDPRITEALDAPVGSAIIVHNKQIIRTVYIRTGNMEWIRTYSTDPTQTSRDVVADRLRKDLQRWSIAVVRIEP